MREPIYIVDGVRTPFAKAGTTLADSEAVDLGKTASDFWWPAPESIRPGSKR